MRKLRILGVDPGLSGALALIDDNKRTLEVFDMPLFELKRGKKNKREIDIHSLARCVKRFVPIDMAFFEKVGAMPGQGVTGMFQFGRLVGIVEGILYANKVPIDYVSPRKWRSDLKVRQGKDGSRERASTLMPSCAEIWSRKKDVGRAEATLIAIHGKLFSGFFSENNKDSEKKDARSLVDFKSKKDNQTPLAGFSSMKEMENFYNFKF